MTAVTAVTVTPGGTFDELFERERAAMVRVAYLIAGSRAVGEEVTQEAFVAVYERCRPGGSSPGCTGRSRARAPMRSC